MQREHLLDLRADPVDGTEAAHRALRQDRDAPAAHSAPVGTAGEFVAVEQGGTRDLGGGGQQAEQRASQRGLAAAALADQGQDLALGDVEAHPVERGRPAVADGELAQGQRHRVASLSAGLSRSSTAMPMSASPSTVSVIAAPGGSAHHSHASDRNTPLACTQ